MWWELELFKDLDGWVVRGRTFTFFRIILEYELKAIQAGYFDFTILISNVYFMKIAFTDMPHTTYVYGRSFTIKLSSFSNFFLYF